MIIELKDRKITCTPEEYREMLLKGLIGDGPIWTGNTVAGIPPVQPGPSPQRWMAATNPPHNMREVLICAPIRGHLAVCLGHYNYSSRQWYLHDGYDPTEVAYWSEKPLPPEKG